MKLVEIYGIFISLFSYFVYIKEREREFKITVWEDTSSQTHINSTMTYGINLMKRDMNTGCTKTPQQSVKGQF